MSASIKIHIYFLNLKKKETDKIIPLAHDFTNQEQARYRKQKNEKLAIRYACLTTFFRSQIKSK